MGAFLAHGFVDQEANAFGQAAAGALLSEELQNSIQEFRIRLVGRHGFALDVFGDTPTGNHYGPPSTSFGWRQPPFGGGCAPARYARLRSAAPEGGLGGGKKSNLQNYVYTNLLHSAFFLLHFLPSPPKCPGPWPATPTIHEKRLDDVQIGGKGIRRFHPADLAQFQQRAKHCATSGAPFVLAQREQTYLLSPIRGTTGSLRWGYGGMSGRLGGAVPPIPPKTAKKPGLRHWARVGGRQRGELRSVGQGFVTCQRAGIAGDPPRLASTRARRSGGGSGAPLTSLRCWVLPLAAAMLLAPELNATPLVGRGSVLI